VKRAAPEISQETIPDLTFMKTRLLLTAALAASVSQLQALELTHANPGTDGAFEPTGAHVVVDLSKATTGAWDSATPDNDFGVYDPEKWAVVFKFSSLHVRSGTTVTFKNHPSRAPVVWLVEGDAIIDGSVDISGDRNDTDANRIRFAEPGPGGFRGGDMWVPGMPGPFGVSGFGPGGGRGYIQLYQWGQYSSHANAGFAQGSLSPVPAYGNSTLIPLIGGSGAGPYTAYHEWGGAAGGGAMLLVVKGNLEFNGQIRANGGVDSASGGSGGAVRVVAETTSGIGLVQALNRFHRRDAEGRIRIECNNPVGFSFQPNTFPVAPRVPVQLWPEPAAPTARIVSVNGLNAPADPRASMDFLAPADLRVPAGSRTNLVTVETVNLPTNAVVTLRVISTPSGDDERLTAEYLSTDPANPNRHLWSRQVVIQPGFHALQVVARVP
jgi:plastocyanin